MTRQTAGTAITLSANVAAASNVWQHVAFTFDGVTNHFIRCYINGQLNNVVTNAGLTSLRGSPHELTIGNRQSTATSAYNLPTTNIVFDEIRLWNRTLAASEVFEAFAFNGAVSHGQVPIITTQPRSVTNYIGDTAPFSVATDNVNSTQPVFLQWYSNGIPIVGSTTTTLVLPNVQLSSSAQFSVVASNIVGNTTSSVVNLTVQSLPAPNITSGLKAEWTFDDIAGSSTAADASGNGNTLYLTNYADFTSCWVAGLTNGALWFNTNGTTLTIGQTNVAVIPAIGSPAPPSLDFSVGGSFTLAAFVNATLPQTNGGALFCKGSGNGGEQFAVDMNGNNYRFYVRGTNSTGAFINPTANTAVSPNGTWQHVAAVCDCVNGIMNIYVNGQLAGAGVAPLTLLTNAHEVSLGSRQSGAATPYNLPFTGAMDEARIYNRALTSADIQALYATGGLFPPTVSTQPVGGSAFVGEDFKFTTVVGGTAPFTYRWKTNGVNATIANASAGSTNLTLTLTNVQLGNAADYTLAVTNAYGGTNSTIATLTVTNFYVTNQIAGWWKFDDATGSTAVDSSVNANNGTLVNFAPNNPFEELKYVGPA